MRQCSEICSVGGLSVCWHSITAQRWDLKPPKGLLLGSSMNCQSTCEPGSPATLNMLITRTVPSWLPPAPDQVFKPQSGLLSHFQPQGQVRISFMRWHQVEFTFASTSIIPKGSLLKVSVPTCKIFGILLVLIRYMKTLGLWTTDLAKMTINVQESKCGVWDTIWANDKIEHLR